MAIAPGVVDTVVGLALGLGLVLIIWLFFVAWQVAQVFRRFECEWRASDDRADRLRRRIARRMGSL